MKNMPLSLLLLVLFLTACAPGAATPTAQPAADNPTPNPAAGFDLEAVMLQPDDLPDRIMPADFFDDVPPALYQVPRAEKIYSRGLVWADQAGGGEAGFLVGLVYASPQALETAWNTITEDLFSMEAVEGLGERAAADFSQVAFTRCQTLVFVRIDGVYLEEDILPLAKRIDNRLLREGCLY